MILLAFPQFLNFSKKKEADVGSDNSLIILLEKIKSGDEALREKFILDHRPFILKILSKIKGKFIKEDNHNEFSIGMEAFNEAINRYDLKMRSNFFKFSEQVIRSRIIDDYRKTRKDNMVYPFSYISECEGFEERYLASDSHYMYEQIEVKEDINCFKKELSEFGITIMDLALCSPKHGDSRRLLISVARILAQDDILFEKLKRNKKIPRDGLSIKANVHIRTIENNRKYIIAVALILNSNLDLSKRFFRSVIEEGR